MKSLPTKMAISLSVLAVVLAPGLAVAGDTAVELVHPQGDDQGNFVAPVVGPRITVIGLVSSTPAVTGVTVNGRAAQLFEAQMAPYHADGPAVEFRANVQLHPNKKLHVRIASADGAVVKMDMVPDTDRATARIRALAAQNPDDVRMQCRLGSCLKDQGKTEEAVAELRKVLDEGQACVNTRVTIGKALVSMGMPEEGMKEFALATEVAPDYAMGWLYLGLAQARFMRNTERAVVCFRKYLALEPESSIADKVARFIETVEP